MSLSHPSDPDRRQQVPDDVRDQVGLRIVGLYRATFGHAPTRVRTYVQPEFCVCVLGGILSPAEQRLVQSGDMSRVEDGRLDINRTIDADLVGIVEDGSGRTVLSHLARVKPAVEVAVHFFLFDEATAAGTDL